MKTLLIAAAIFITAFFFLINSSLVADQAEAWVKEHPADVHAPEVLYRAGRWCDLLGDNDKALAVYWDLYQKYPDHGEFCAPAMYYSAQIKADATAARRMANSYLDIVMNQYANEDGWPTRAKELYDEVNYVH